MSGPAASGRRASAAALARRIALDLSPLRESRDFRLLMTGQVISGVGSQIALVALPTQIFLLSHSAALVGLLGAFELAPMIVASLLGGAIVDRLDRRRVLIAAQLGVVGAAAGLAVVTLVSHPPVAVILVLGGLLAGGAALDNVTRAAIVPRVVSVRRLRSALAFNYGAYQLTGIVGPAVGGLLIAAAGLGTAYVIDAGSCVAMVAAAFALSPQPPVVGDGADAGMPAAAGPIGPHAVPRPSIARSILDGLRFVRGNRALSGSFAIDLVAMTFGWPRSMFAVLSLTVYHAGSRGTGLLFAALAVGGTLSVLTAGWIEHARRLGRIVIGVVVVWGAAIAGMGLVRSLAPAIGLLAVAGFADGVSAVCRSTINQTVTPDGLRGRMSAVYTLVVTGGPRLGDIESGLVAGVTSAATSVLTGGLACIAGAGVIVVLFPALARYGDEAPLG